MTTNSVSYPSTRQRLRAALSKFWQPYKSVPLLGWLVAALVAVGLEQLVGLPLARVLGMSKVPALFGLVVALDKPILFPSALLYMILIYFLPIGIVARLLKSITNTIAEKLIGYPLIVTALIHYQRLPHLGSPPGNDCHHPHTQPQRSERLYGGIFMFAPGVHVAWGVCGLRFHDRFIRIGK